MIGRTIRLIRVYHDVSVKDMASRLSMSSGSVSDMESGRRQPTLRTLTKYAMIFGMPVSKIMEFDEMLNNIKCSDKMLLQRTQLLTFADIFQS